MAKQPIRITAPFDESVARSLKAGDGVLISGTIIAARDDLKQAIADIDKLKAFVKSVSKFLALVDKLIDLLA